MPSLKRKPPKRRRGSRSSSEARQTWDEVVISRPEELEEYIESSLTPEAVRRELKREAWFQGRLRYLTRPGPQRDLYDAVHGKKDTVATLSPWVWNLHRRLGKTFLAVLLLVERAVRQQAIRCKFACYTTSQAVEIIEEQFAAIMVDCPPELEPKAAKGEKFYFSNPRWGAHTKWARSILRLYGVRDDYGNKMRGGSTEACAFDECREFTRFSYTWTDVVLPTFEGAKEPLAIFLSTPPESADHPWQAKYIPQAQDKCRYVCVPASKDPNWTQGNDDMYALEMGGRDSVAYRREIECELIADTTNLVVPEFVLNDNREEDGSYSNEWIHREWERPESYYAFSVGDFGGTKDYYGMVYGFVDFDQARVVVERDLFLDDTSLDTRTVAEKWKEVEAEAFPEDLPPPKKLIRLGDAPAQRLQDLHKLYGLTIGQVPKYDKMAARNQLRSGFCLGQISISEECPDLIFQLRNGRKKPNGDFERSEIMGHCDVLAAMIYCFQVAQVYLSRNPRPLPAQPSSATHFVPPRDKRGGGGAPTGDAEERADAGRASE